MKKALRVILPILVILGGLGAARTIVKLKPKADRKAAEHITPAVEVVLANPTEARARVQATGQVRAAREVSVVPQVSGAVTWVHPQLVPGGRIEAGTVIARIDRRDYEALVEAEKARVEQAKLGLALEENQARIAKKEWQMLGKNRPQEQSEFAQRIPQLKNAQRQLEAAEASLKRAELNLSRTSLRAPFNAIVVDERVEVGQVVGPGSMVATLIGTDQFWVVASIPVDQLAGIDFPDETANPNALGSRVSVSQDLGGGQSIDREGRVLRLAGTLDPQTRTANVYVGLDNPLSTEGGAPILPGAFVNLGIEGRDINGVIPVPRLALVDGNKVWTVSPEGRLKKKQVSVGWRDSRSVFVTEGLSPGDRVVVSPLSLPVENQEVQVVGQRELAASPSAGDEG